MQLCVLVAVWLAICAPLGSSQEEQAEIWGDNPWVVWTGSPTWIDRGNYSRCRVVISTSTRTTLPPTQTTTKTVTSTTSTTISTTTSITTTWTVTTTSSSPKGTVTVTTTSSNWNGSVTETETTTTTTITITSTTVTTTTITTSSTTSTTTTTTTTTTITSTTSSTTTTTTTQEITEPEVSVPEITTEKEKTVNVVYTCRRRTTQLTRVVQVLKRLLLTEPVYQTLRQASGAWTDPGMACFDNKGKAADATLTPSSIDLAVEADHLVSYDCFGGIAKRLVRIRRPLRLIGPAHQVLLQEGSLQVKTTWSDPGSVCIGTSGQELWLPPSRPVLSLRYRTTEAVLLFCPDTRSLARLAQVRSPILLEDDGQRPGPGPRLLPRAANLDALYVFDETVLDDTNTAVEEWNNLAQTMSKLSPSSSGCAWQAKGVGGLPSVVFTGSCKYGASISGTYGEGGEMTAFMLVRSTGGTEARQLLRAWRTETTLWEVAVDHTANSVNLSVAGTAEPISLSLTFNRDVLLVARLNGGWHHLIAYTMTGDRLGSVQQTSGSSIAASAARRRRRAYEFGLGETFIGLVRHIAVYNTALTDDEIDQVKASLLQRPACTPEAMRACADKVPCLHLREGSNRNLVMQMDGSNARVKEVSGDTSWSCTCSSDSCKGLWGEWTCSGIYTEPLRISPDLDDNFLAQTSGDTVDACVPEARYRFFNTHLTDSPLAVVALRDDTQVTLPDSSTVTLKAGEAWDFSATEGQDLSADKPVHVVGSCISAYTCEQTPHFVITAATTTWQAVQCPDGYALASVHSLADQTAIESLLEATSYWIGLRSAITDEDLRNVVWSWQDGSPLDYSHWPSASPTIAAEGTCAELVVSTAKQTTHVWGAAQDCAVTRKAVCRLRARCNRKACPEGFLLREDSSSRYCKALCNVWADRDTCCEEVRLQAGGHFEAPTQWNPISATCVEEDPLNDYAMLYQSQVGASSCTYPSEYPQRTTEIKNRNILQCAALCTQLKSSCTGFNMKSDGCEICNNTDVLRSAGTVTAYLKTADTTELAAPPPPFQHPVVPRGFEELSTESCISVASSTKQTSLTLAKCAESCTPPSCTHIARSTGLGSLATGDCYRTTAAGVISSPAGGCSLKVYQMMEVRIRVLNTEDVSNGWEMRSLKLFSDRACTVEIPTADAFAAAYTRSATNAAWQAISHASIKSFLNGTSTEVTLQQGSSCPAQLCAFEVIQPGLSPSALTLQCVHLYQGAAGQAASGVAILQQEPNGASFQELWTCTGLSTTGNVWGACAKPQRTICTGGAAACVHPEGQCPETYRYMEGQLTHQAGGLQNPTSYTSQQCAWYCDMRAGCLAFEWGAPQGQLLPGVCLLHAVATVSGQPTAGRVLCAKRQLREVLVTRAPTFHSASSLGLQKSHYSCTDSAGSLSVRTRDVRVRAPLQLVGEQFVRAQLNPGQPMQVKAVWTDPGATCVDSSLSPLSVTSSLSSIVVDRVGSHSVTYTCKQGETTVQTLQRTVEVVEAFALYGTNPYPVLTGATYKDPGYLCVAESGQPLLATVEPSAVTTSHAGHTIRSYTCTDAGAHVGRSVSRTVAVAAATPSVVLRGRASGNVVSEGESYVDPSACCLDSGGILLAPPTRTQKTSNGVVAYRYSCKGPIGTRTAAVREVAVNSVPQVQLLGSYEAQTTLGKDENGATYQDPGAICLDAEDGPILHAGHSGLGQTRTLAVLRGGAVDVVEGDVETTFDGATGTSGTAVTNCQTCLRIVKMPTLTGFQVRTHEDEQAFPFYFAPTQPWTWQALQACDADGQHSVQVETDVTFEVQSSQSSHPSTITYLRLDTGFKETFDFTSMAAAGTVNVSFDGQSLTCSVSTNSFNCRGLPPQVPVPVVLISINFQPRGAGAVTNPAGEWSRNRYTTKGSFYRATCSTKHIDGPMVGGCGGEPYLHPTTGESVSDNTVDTAFPGSFDDCRTLCMRMRSCTKFQRSAQGSCYFSGSNSPSTGETEPNSDTQWTCGLVRERAVPSTAVQQPACTGGSCEPFLWLDLGTVRVVHSLVIYGELTGGSVLISEAVPQKDRQPQGSPCLEGVTVAASSSKTVSCRAPLAGRYVVLLAASMRVCEVTITGTQGPAAPARVQISADAACTGVPTGIFELGGASWTLGAYYKAAMTQAVGGEEPSQVLKSASGIGSFVACQQLCMSELYCKAVVYQTSANPTVCSQLSAAYSGATPQDSGFQVSSKVTDDSYSSMSGSCTTSSATFVQRVPAAIPVRSVKECQSLCSGEPDCKFVETNGWSCALRKTCTVSAGQCTMCAYSRQAATTKGATLMREAETGPLWTPGRERWVLRDAAQNIKAMAEGGATPPVSGWGPPSGADQACSSLRVRPKDASDACTWLFGFSPETGAFECVDGTTCKEDGCCQGQLARCPRDKPQMCAETCGQDHCCKVSCTKLRVCQQSSLGTGSSSATTLARIETSSTINTNVPGTYRVVHTCRDSAGAESSVSRSVEIVCQSHNPSGLHGGNRVDCSDSLAASGETRANREACAQDCLADRACEAYEYIRQSSTCNFRTNCTGRYYLGVVDDRDVAVCRRRDQPPAVIVTEGNDTVLQGQNWVEPGYSCYDAEDDPNPVASKSGDVDTSVPGKYPISYTCTDQALQTQTKVREVSVLENCQIPARHRATDIPVVCGGGTQVKERGFTCAVQCPQGYAAESSQATCQENATAGGSFKSDWAPTPECGPIPCDLPTVTNGLESNGDAAPCGEGVTRLIHGEKCTSSCKDSNYKPTYSSLTCNQGNLQPSTFQCLKKADQPLSLLVSTIGTVHVDLEWFPGALNDCVFLKYRVQQKFDDAKWQDVANPDCASNTRCRVEGLVEGGMYRFRVQTRCNSTLGLDSKAKASAQRTQLKAVTVPTALLQLPNGSVSVDPRQVLLALAAPCTVSQDTSLTAELLRVESTRCTESLFKVTSANIGAGTESGLGTTRLVSNRIVLATPPANFFEAGCQYQMLLRAKLFQTTEMPTKFSPEFKWDFEWFDPPPIRLSLKVTSQATRLDGVEVGIEVTHDIPTQLNCTVSAVDPNEQPLTHIGEPAPDKVTQDLTQSLDQTPVTFTVPNLVPSKNYTIECTGHRLGKPWLNATCANNAPCPSVWFMSAADNSAAIAPVEIRKTAVCKDGNEQLIEAENRTSQELSLGNLLLVNSYELKCNMGNPLPVGDQARLRISGSTSALSMYARLRWIKGPVVECLFTKQGGTQEVVLNSVLSFEVCTHAQVVAGGTGCVVHQMKISCLDSRVEVNDLTVQGNRLDTTSNVTIRIGESVLLGMIRPQEFNLNEAIVVLGLPTDGFTQQHRLEGANGIRFEAEGQGLLLPVTILWKGVAISSKFRISFEPPTLTVAEVKVPLVGDRPTLEAQLGQTPTTASVIASAVVTKYLQLEVFKEGQTPSQPGLCVASPQFVNWTNVSCALRAMALQDVVVRLSVRNHFTGNFEVASGTTLKGRVTAQHPTLLRIVWNVGGTETSPVEMDQVRASDGPKIFIKGSNFPELSSVELGGAAVQGYQVYMEAEPETAAPLAPLCKEVQVINSALLSCTPVRCFEAQYLPLEPAVWLQLGDLKAAQRLTSQLRLPSPVVTQIGPVTVENSGASLIWFKGTALGAPSGSLNSSECTSDGPPMALGNATAQVGNVECEVRTQNDSYIECNTSDSPKRALIGPPAQGQDEGQLIREQDVQVQLKFGGHRSLTGTTPKVKTTITELCKAGQYRSGSDLLGCTDCPRGRFSKPGSTLWPVGCDFCPSTSYQDKPGQTVCTKCPANTASQAPAEEVTSCRCLPGYYSPVAKALQTTETALVGEPGKACVPCHSVEMTTEPFDGQVCASTIAVSTSGVCDVSTVQVCVPTTPTTLRLCKAYCPGGTEWPRAQPWFYFLGQEAAVAGGSTEAGSQVKATVEKCQPTVACGADNKCTTGYTGTSCAQCDDGFYRQQSNQACLKCDDGARTGTILMGAGAFFIALASFMVSLLYLKCLVDPLFANRVEALVARFMGLLTCFTAGLSDRLFTRRVQVNFRVKTVSRSWGWQAKKDLGLILRVSPETRQVQVAGVRPGSPACRLGIRSGWRMLLLEGWPVRAFDEQEVHDKIAELTPPFAATFRAPRFKSKQKQEGGASAKDLIDMTKTGTRLLIISMTTMQSFNGIMRLNLDFPPFFLKVAGVMQSVMLSFDFFHPECSVPAPYDKKWLAFVNLPYIMVLPLTLSFIIISCQAHYASWGNPQLKEVQRWLLINAWTRCLMAMLLVFLQFHMEQLISPFVCVTAFGSKVMKYAPDINCSSADPVYSRMVKFAYGYWAVLCAIYAGIMVCIRKSYLWQSGNHTRDYLPFYVSMLESSTSGMRGHVSVLRTRLLSNTTAVGTYRPERNASGDTQPEAALAAQVSKESMPVCRDDHRAQMRFQEALRPPTSPGGNLLTYGWVLIINSFGRQFLLLLAVVFSSSFTPFGAAAQSFIFAFNFMLVLLVFPYESYMLNCQEALLTGCLAFLTWIACFRELLKKNTRAAQFPGTVATTSTIIDVLIVVVACTIVVTLMYNVFLLVQAVIQKESQDAVLNRAHFRRRLDEERHVIQQADRMEEDDGPQDTTADAGQDPTKRVWGELAAYLAECPDAQEALRLKKLVTAIMAPYATTSPDLT